MIGFLSLQDDSEIFDPGFPDSSIGTSLSAFGGATRKSPPSFSKSSLSRESSG